MLLVSVGTSHGGLRDRHLLNHLSVRGLNKQFVLHGLGGKRVMGCADVAFDPAAGRLSGRRGPERQWQVRDPASRVQVDQPNLPSM